jgi:hypothetical protein
MNNTSCGSQGADISLADGRVKFPCSFHYAALFFRHLLDVGAFIAAWSMQLILFLYIP